MKKLSFLATLLLLFLIATGCSSTTKKQTTSTSAQVESIVNKTNVSAEEAIRLFQAKYPNTVITALELEQSLGQPVYKLEGVDQQTEYEVKLNAKTKKFSDEHKETLDADDQNKQQEDQLNVQDLLSLKKAAAAAQKKVHGTPVEFELDKEMNITYWNVTLQDGKKEHAVKVNAQTGEVLEHETDD